MSSTLSSSLFLSCLMNLLVLLPLSYALNITSSHAPLCHDDERSALLQFKNSFLIDCQVSDDPLSYPKVDSWKLKTGRRIDDCCSWDGVSCDENTGHVIGIDLSSSCLYGSINSTSSLFHLPHLRTLNLAHNHFNYSLIPSEMGFLSELTSLNLSYSSFAGQIPSAISQLSYLTILDLTTHTDLKLRNPDFGSLVQNLTKLEDLRLSYIDISSTIPSILKNFSSMISLRLTGCGLYGEFPVEIFGLPNLEILKVAANPNLRGHFPEFNSTSPIQFLLLSRTSFSGKLPKSVGNLPSLNVLDINYCRFVGDIPASLGNLEELIVMNLALNNFQVKNSSSLSWIGKLTKLQALGVSGVSFNKFPSFLSNLTQLETWYFPSNQLKGLIPEWLWKSTLSLTHIDLSNNFLTGFEQNPRVLPWTLIYIDLSNNMLKGSLPIPPSSLEAYFMGNNTLSGEIPPIIWTLNALVVLDLSNNKFTGMLPLSLSNFGTSVEALVLEGNNFHGKFHDNLVEGCSIRYLNLDSNEIEGKVPRSLANCTNLENLILGSNKIYDVFPSWLGALEELMVLILRYNQFYGPLENHVANSGFPKLCIIDVSHNNFSGKLPAHYFLNWNAMKMTEADQLSYMETSNENLHYWYTMTLVTKGTKVQYNKILESLVAIDLSSNKFEGSIPQVIGDLKALHLLNLSNNNLHGSIPTSLGNLIELEALDLSGNNLIGEIPQELTQLGFLSIFNVSYNHLTGPIPHGKQFGTFENSSYWNNSDLCGNPLPKKCGNPDTLQPSSNEVDKDRGSHFGFDWKPVALGSGSGLIVGGITAHRAISRKYEWFSKIFRISQARPVRGRSLST